MRNEEKGKDSIITVSVQELHLGNQGANGEQSELDLFTL